MTSLSKPYRKCQSKPTGDTEARRKREAKAQAAKHQTNNYEGQSLSESKDIGVGTGGSWPRQYYSLET